MSATDDNPIELTSAAELAQELDGLRTAMGTRAAIEQAKGVLMALHGCDSSSAFGLLVRESQQKQKKLHDVATELLDSVQRR